MLLVKRRSSDKEKEAVVAAATTAIGNEDRKFSHRGISAGSTGPYEAWRGLDFDIEPPGALEGVRSMEA